MTEGSLHLAKTCHNGKTNHHHAPYCVWDILSFDRHMCKNWQRKKPAASLPSWKLSMPCIVACPACGALSPTRNWLRLAGCFNDCAQLLISTWISCAELQRTTRWDSHTIPQLPSRYQRSHAWWALVHICSDCLSSIPGQSCQPRKNHPMILDFDVQNLNECYSMLFNCPHVSFPNYILVTIVHIPTTRAIGVLPCYK